MSVVRRGLIAVLLILAGCQMRPDTMTEPMELHANGAVACDHEIASQAGVEILQRGGNAVDAAVAASFTLSVVRPYSCGIGGGGFMTIYVPADGETPAQCVALNYRETAPAAVAPSYYEDLRARGMPDDVNRAGHHAVAIPGTVAGLLDALDRYGTLDRATVLAPAIRAARTGFRVDADYRGAYDVASTWAESQQDARRYAPIVNGKLMTPIEPGPWVTNEPQARALELIARDGADAFYRGPIADAIVREMQAHGGPITHDDLARYRVRDETPLMGTFRGHVVHAFPSPSSGGIAMLQMFGLLERRLDDLAVTSPDDPAFRHLLVECMKHAFADRAEHLADDDFVDVPTNALLDAAYLDELAQRIELDSTQDLFAYGSAVAAPDDGGTSHLSVIDASGMAVACTETINVRFGSKVVVPEFGFCLNNEMDDFTTIRGETNAYGLRQSDRNLPEPGKRPLSSMSPTIVTRDGDVVLIAGASGGPRIISGTAQAILNVLLFDDSAANAIQRERIHHQWQPDVVQFEAWGAQPGRADASRQRAMQAYGHETRVRPRVGVVQMIVVHEDGIEAASDPRKGGRSAGY
ncbi:MAG: gamma-glutamyltransferase [Planctomycetota bacterium]